MWGRLKAWATALLALSDRHSRQMVNIAMRHKGWSPVRRHHVNRKG